MPTSRSRSPRTDSKAPPPARRAYWPLIPLAIVVAAGTLIAALPATVITHFLPPRVRMRDVSGSIWHGVAGSIAIDARDAGAVEWRLRPLGLLRGAADLQVHWVDRGVAIDASIRLDPHSLRASRIQGGGPIADLGALGVPPGWRGTAQVDLGGLATDFARIQSIEGELRVANLASPAIADGADLGGYALRFGDAGPPADPALEASAQDTGGPLRLRAHITIDQGARRGTVSGTVAARPDAPAALVAELDQIARVRGRDADGGVPLDLEFTF
jgi:Type II secretion system (T2SS), protein N